MRSGAGQAADTAEGPAVPRGVGFNVVFGLEQRGFESFNRIDPV